jgi:hypothetical protein
MEVMRHKAVVHSFLSLSPEREVGYAMAGVALLP